MIGLGASSISDLWTAFAQNEKSVDAYLDQIGSDRLALTRGHILGDEDLRVRQNILDLMCRFGTDLADWDEDGRRAVRDRLSEMEEDRLIEWSGSVIRVLPAGVPFVRNICMALDLRMLGSRPAMELFSRTV